MVRVAVPTLLVVAGDDLRAERTDDGGQPARGIVEVGLVEAVGVGVVVGVHHAAVAVAQELVVGDAEHVQGVGQLLETQLGHRALAQVQAREVLAGLAPGAVDQLDPHAGLVHVARQRATGRDALVVGVGLDHQQAEVGHEGLLRRGRLRTVACRTVSTRPDLDIDLVDDPSRLAAALATVDEEVVGVDVERADADRYFRSAALIQVGVPGRCVLVDSHLIDDLSTLDAFFAERTVILHALENDLVPLANADVAVPHVHDTAIAASVLGIPIGLDPLLQELLDVSLTSDKSRFQRADWEQRPLPDDMAAYAAGDVVHLPELWRRIEQQLREAGRYDWYEQELAYVIERTWEDTRDWERTKGASRLSPQQRAVLKHVWERRESLAREHDIAPQRLVRDDTLTSWASEPPSDVDEVIKRAGRRRKMVSRHVDDLLDAIEEGVEAEPEERETSGRRWSDEDRAAYDAMRRARAARADELGLDPGVLCPSKTLWGAVAGDPQSPQELCDLAGLRPWQAELLDDVLWQAYQDAYATDEGDADDG